MALRIIAGDLKGRKLRTVNGMNTRPTANRTREAIFNILSFQISGSQALDLFAGTGAYGIEALSRGADSVVFLDRDNDSISVLQSNIKSLSLEKKTKIIQWDVVKNLNCLHPFKTTFDLVFMDPPYKMHMIEPALQNLHDSRSLAGSAKIVVEHYRKESILTGPLPFEITSQRKYGKTLVTFLDYVV
jgi:16S rRNA (guanine966-N2)-methyltransferase